MKKTGDKGTGSGKAQKLLENYTRKELRERDVESLIDLILDLEKKFSQLSMRCSKLEKISTEQAKIIIDLKTDQNPKEKYEGYDNNKSWVWKLCFVLQKHGQPMTIKEIKAVLLLLEVDLESRWANIDHYLSQVALRAIDRGFVGKSKSWHSAGHVYSLMLKP